MTADGGDTRVMNQADYLSKRVDDQIAWYGQKSSWNQRLYKRLRALEIACAAAIPLVVGFVTEQTLSLKLLAGLLGVVVAIVTGIVALYKFQENWIQYRTTAESLKQEKFLFLAAAGPYAVLDPFPLFVQRIEYLLSRENSGWAQYMQEVDSQTPRQGAPQIERTE